tara:strand:+ start:15680 stop:16897 length:1218 start_codon:yes stop_codon:yes gene_type:complete
MRKKDIQFTKLPDAPGVYLFLNARKEILYIGKATSIRNRIRSYFGKHLDDTRGPLLVTMRDEATAVTFEKTDSVLEALILEANLIKKHHPRYNTRDRDNKSFNYLIITNEDFPRVLIVRGRDLFSSWKERDIKRLFGPFPGGGLKEALKTVRKIFPFRDACAITDHKPCFNQQIGLCPGVCIGSISKTKYLRTIRHVQLLFEGKKKKLLETLTTEMKRLAKMEEFEKASEVKRKIFALTHIQETALIGSDYKVSSGSDMKRVEGYDVAHMSEQNRVGVMVVVTEGKARTSDYRKFNIATKKKGDVAALEELLQRRFNHDEWSLPDMIVIDGGIAQRNAAQRVLDTFEYAIPLVHVVKNDKHKVSRIIGNRALVEKYQNEILLANAEAHRFSISFHKQKQRKNLLT